MMQIKAKTVLRNYNIFLKKGVFADAPFLIKSHISGFDKFIFITNKTISEIYSEQIKDFCQKLGPDYEILCLEDGEEFKSFKSVESAYSTMIKHNFHRNDIVIAFGGGVIGDTAGYISATFHRGMKLVHIPTTIIGQVDSSIGGKVVVNFEGKKNMIGTFYQPHMIIIDPSFLESLDKKQIINGLGEIVKYGLIFDKNILVSLDKIVSQDNYTTENLIRYENFTGLIHRCAFIKTKVVEKDEFDQSYRNLLNFGHTIGHSIENLSGLRQVSHGQAISMGMIASLEISMVLGYLSKKEMKRIKLLFKKFGLPFKISLNNVDKVIDELKYDKKFTGNSNRFILLKGINRPFFNDGIKKEVIVNSINNCIDR